MMYQNGSSESAGAAIELTSHGRGASHGEDGRMSNCTMKGL